MEFFWIQLSKKPPPIITIKSTVKEEDIVKLDRTFKKSVKTLDKFYKEILNEMRVFSKLIFREKLALHNYKLFKSMQRVNCCVKKFDNLNLTSTYKSFYQCISRTKEEVEDGYIEKSLPSKQMLEHLLIRTLAVSYLAVQVCWHCCDIIQYAFQELKMGFHVSVSSTIAACTSRIWLLFTVLLKNCTIFYKNLHSYLAILPSSGIEWMPEDETFPEKIQKCSFWKCSPPPLWPKKTATDSVSPSTEEMIESAEIIKDKDSKSLQTEVTKVKKKKKLNNQNSKDNPLNDESHTDKNLQPEDTVVVPVNIDRTKEKRSLKLLNEQDTERTEILNTVLAADTIKRLTKVLRRICKKLSEENHTISVMELKPFIKKLNNSNDEEFCLIKDELIDYLQNILITQKTKKKSKALKNKNLKNSKTKKKGAALEGLLTETCHDQQNTNDNENYAKNNLYTEGNIVNFNEIDSIFQDIF